MHQAWHQACSSFAARLQRRHGARGRPASSTGRRRCRLPCSAAALQSAAAAAAAAAAPAVSGGAPAAGAGTAAAGRPQRRCGGWPTFAHGLAPDGALAHRAQGALRGGPGTGLPWRCENAWGWAQSALCSSMGAQLPMECWLRRSRRSQRYQSAIAASPVPWSLVVAPQGVFGSVDTPMSSNSLNAILDELGK